MNSPFANREIGRWRDLAMIYTNIETGLYRCDMFIFVCMRSSNICWKQQKQSKTEAGGRCLCGSEAEGIVPKKHEHVSLLTSALRIQAGRVRWGHH